MDTQKQRRNEGMALITVTLIVAVTVIVLGALTVRVVNQSHQVDKYVNFKDCMYGADSAYASAIVSLEAGSDGMVAVSGWSPPPGRTPPVPQFGDSGISPRQLPNQPDIEYFAYTVDWSTDGTDNNGDGSADGPDELGFYNVYAASRSTQPGVSLDSRNGYAAFRSTETVVAAYDVNVWRNAIFAGAGQAGGIINGNVSIHGSVHLLGDNLAPGGVAVAALDLSGTSLIHNNYVGLSAALQGRIPALPTRDFNGETVSTLNAKLRVRNGLVGMSGTSEIGQPDVFGNGVKETMDGCHVSDGWTGNSVLPDGDRGDPTAVYSDNGWDDTYDLGSKVPFPMLNDDYQEMFSGDKVLSPDGDWYRHREYFSDVLTGAPHEGAVTIRADQNFYYNATRPLDPNPANRLPTDDFIFFDAATNVMEMNGQIQINGDLVITRGGGNDKTINYTGRAAIFATGNVTLDTDLLPQNANGTTANSFPVNNIFGVMAGGNMSVGNLAQVTLMGAFYAQGQIYCPKQTTVIGTFVSQYFNMGTNVPDIYQVPTLPENLPLGMVGAYPIFTYSPVSWRELGT